MSEAGLYKVSTICERTGFTPGLLRVWERRHEGLLDPHRTEGGHRLYTPDDLRVLMRVRRLLDEGRSIGEIAALGRGALLSAALREVGPAGPEAATSPGGEAPGGAGVAGEPRLEGWRSAFVEAAVAMDDVRLVRVLDQVFALMSPPVAIAQVIQPSLYMLGDQWAAGRASVASEHLASAALVGRLLRLIEAAQPPAGNGSRAAICACLPDEQHEIGALVVAYALARLHHRVAYLGASMPLTDLEGSCQTLRPTLLCLSVSRASLLATHEPRLVEMTRRLRPTRILVGGRGVEGPWPALEEAGVELILPAQDLTSALLSGSGARPRARKPRRG